MMSQAGLSAFEKGNELGGLAAEQRSMTAPWSRYGEQEIALLIDFRAGSHAIRCEETARLRAETAGPGEGSQPAGSQR